MEIGRIQGTTRVIGKSQGYLGLSLRDVVVQRPEILAEVKDVEVDCTVNGPNTPAMETAWLPNPREIEAIAAGAPIILRVLGTQHPPVLLYVGDKPK